MSLLGMASFDEDGFVLAPARRDFAALKMEVFGFGVVGRSWEKGC